MKKYIRSDGNGGLIINKIVFGVLVTILLSLIPVVYAYGQLNNKVDNLEWCTSSENHLHKFMVN